MKHVASLLMMFSCICISPACSKGEGAPVGDSIAKAESPVGAEPNKRPE